MKKSAAKRALSLLLTLLLALSVLTSCGSAPTIEVSSDGYWVIDGKKTDVPAKGKNGTDGEDGTDGENGKNGRDGRPASTGLVARRLGYLVVTDRITLSEGLDVTSTLQALINANPQTTLYFPDGEYLISDTLKTSANPKKSVSFVFSDGAVLKADPKKFPEGKPLISFGGAEAFNNVTTPGSNYGLEGGILDCSGIANGIEIASGRETAVRHCLIRNAVIGIDLRRGANSGSADADISDLRIVGNDTPASVGIYCEASDNTFSNIRISHATVGVFMKACGNSLIDISAVYSFENEAYPDSYGFYDSWDDNFYYHCTSEQFRVGFYFGNASPSSLFLCEARWTSPLGGEQIAMKCAGKFNSVVTSFRVKFSSSTFAKNKLVDAGGSAGKGYITDVSGSVKNLPEDNAGREYVRGGFFDDE